MPPRLPTKSLAQKVLQQWPKDPLRTNNEFDILQILHERSSADFGDAPPVAPFRPEITDNMPETILMRCPPAKVDVQWGVLNSLIGNKYQKRYPVKRMTEPGFDPEYYKKLIHELDEAPKRSWLSLYLRSWKGFIRWEH
ncbi:hypothetical protein ABW21_db0203220 [Orbilia brochopaga]|nr:hypothetical protein ABW21_db0203220 [Drechslerella brochopaga]